MIDTFYYFLKALQLKLIFQNEKQGKFNIKNLAYKRNQNEFNRYEKVFDCIEYIKYISITTNRPFAHISTMYRDMSYIFHFVYIKDIFTYKVRVGEI